MDTQPPWSLACSRDKSSNLLTALWVHTDFTQEQEDSSSICHWRPAEAGRFFEDYPATEGKLSIVNASSAADSTLDEAPLAGP